MLASALGIDIAGGLGYAIIGGWSADGPTKFLHSVMQLKQIDEGVFIVGSST